MTVYMKRSSGLVMATAIALVLSACGEGSETNAPAVRLTASTVASQTTDAHAHTVDIPFIDVSAAPVDSGYQYRSSSVSGHSHVIALSRQQMVDLNNGMQLTLISSTPGSGAGHTHTWSIQGGSVLYEKNCYNCHGNDNRGRNPMNVVFNAGQINAVRSPGSAPVSSSTPAVPDPIFSSSSIPPDGASLYAGACASCHGPLATSTVSNRTAAQIRTAINGISRMNSLSTLTDAQLQAIATALAK
jgi:mono/diheme cytochrome c family protein